MTNKQPWRPIDDCSVLTESHNGPLQDETNEPELDRVGLNTVSPWLQELQALVENYAKKNRSHFPIAVVDHPDLQLLNNYIFFFLHFAVENLKILGSMIYH